MEFPRFEDIGDDPIETSDPKSDVIVEGSPGSTWDLVCKASSALTLWMKVTKRMTVEGGWLYQVTTEHRSRHTGEVEEADPEPLVE
jgi:hypothetical protein